MIRHSTPTRRQLTAIAAVLALVGTAFPLSQGSVHGAGKETAGKFAEELVYVRSKDAIVNGGAIFAPPKDSAKPIAVIWIHGWGVNFYQPTYVKIGRGIAERGYTCITANTRMHDLANVAAWRWGKRIRGGGYWGVARLVRKCETWPLGSTSPRIEDSRRWCWLDTAPAGRRFAGTRLKSRTDV